MARYGKKAQDKVEKAMHERKRGTLKSRAVGQEGHQPEAGDCHRPLRGAPRRRQGPAQEGLLEEEVTINRESRVGARRPNSQLSALDSLSYGSIVTSGSVLTDPSFVLTVTLYF